MPPRGVAMTTDGTWVDIRGEMAGMDLGLKDKAVIVTGWTKAIA